MGFQVGIKIHQQLGRAADEKYHLVNGPNPAFIPATRSQTTGLSFSAGLIRCYRRALTTWGASRARLTPLVHRAEGTLFRACRTPEAVYIRRTVDAVTRRRRRTSRRVRTAARFARKCAICRAASRPALKGAVGAGARGEKVTQNE